jgi:hypothetical protein
MSAMPALDWPEDEPASWPEDDPTSWPAATWTVPAQPAPTETARRHTPRDQGARDRVVRAQSARDEAAHGHAIPRQAPRGEAVHAQAVRAQAPGVQALRAQTFPDHAAGSRAVHGHAPRGAAAPTPLRLTRRGRIVVAAAAALLVTLLLLLATGATARATSHSAPSRGADRNLSQVVVLPGQSLWSVAQTADPNADPRQVMQQIIELNSLAGDVIQVGQRLWVPRG